LGSVEITLSPQAPSNDVSHGGIPIRCGRAAKMAKVCRGVMDSRPRTRTPALPLRRVIILARSISSAGCSCPRFQYRLQLVQPMIAAAVRAEAIVVGISTMPPLLRPHLDMCQPPEQLPWIGRKAEGREGAN